MSAYIFDRHSVTCPICHHAGKIPSDQMPSGLYTCPNCQARLIIAWSGHYVQDPFTLERLAFGRILRRQSGPMARIVRDLGVVKIIALASVVMLGLAWAGYHISNPTAQESQEQADQTETRRSNTGRLM